LFRDFSTSFFKESFFTAFSFFMEHLMVSGPIVDRTVFTTSKWGDYSVARMAAPFDMRRRAERPAVTGRGTRQ
jgi:hypothetical protein